jgi:hypothetical protein
MWQFAVQLPTYSAHGHQSFGNGYAAGSYMFPQDPFLHPDPWLYERPDSPDVEFIGRQAAPDSPNTWNQLDPLEGIVPNLNRRVTPEEVRGLSQLFFRTRMENPSLLLTWQTGVPSRMTNVIILGLLWSLCCGPDAFVPVSVSPLHCMQLKRSQMLLSALRHALRQLLKAMLMDLHRLGLEMMKKKIKVQQTRLMLRPLRHTSPRSWGSGVIIQIRWWKPHLLQQ